MFGGRWWGGLWAGSGWPAGEGGKMFFGPRMATAENGGPVRKLKCGRGSRFCKNVDRLKNPFGKNSVICVVYCRIMLKKCACEAPKGKKTDSHPQKSEKFKKMGSKKSPKVL